MQFIVHKETGDIDVLLLRHKNTDKWSFVNLTKGHICPCVFDSVDEAIRDMSSRKEQGLILDYTLMSS